jgi:hypothetical protein
MTMMEIFFGGKFNNFVKKFRWVIFLVLTAWSIVSIVLATKLGPLTEEESFLPSDHWAEYAMKIVFYGYFSGAEDLTIEIDLFWGVKSLDKGGIKQWDTKDRGDIKWWSEEQFDPSSEEAQQSLYDFCLSVAANKDLVINGQVDCWVANFKTWADTTLIEGSKKNYIGFPVPQADFYTHLDTYMNTNTGKKESSDYQISTFNDRTYFMYIRAKAFGDPGMIYEEKKKIHESWEQVVDDYIALDSTPEPMKQLRMSGGTPMAWAPSEREFLRGATSGIFIAIAFSFVILLLATQNII